MGVVLDSSILIAGERRKDSVSEVLERVEAVSGKTTAVLSAVTAVELTHGIFGDANNLKGLLKLTDLKKVQKGSITKTAPSVAPDRRSFYGQNHPHQFGLCCTFDWRDRLCVSVRGHFLSRDAPCHRL